MINKKSHLILLNNEYLFSAAHGDIFAPLCINESAICGICDALQNHPLPKTSCIKTVDCVRENGNIVLKITYHSATKCNNSATLSQQSNTEVCSRRLCNGKCTDDFMRNVVAKQMLPELYNTKQK